MEDIYKRFVTSSDSTQQVFFVRRETYSECNLKFSDSTRGPINHSASYETRSNWVYFDAGCFSRVPPERIGQLSTSKCDDYTSTRKLSRCISTCTISQYQW